MKLCKSQNLLEITQNNLEVFAIFFIVGLTMIFIQFQKPLDLIQFYH